jgi:hypothetical protein
VVGYYGKQYLPCVELIHLEISISAIFDITIIIIIIIIIIIMPSSVEKLSLQPFPVTRITNVLRLLDVKFPRP